MENAAKALVIAGGVLLAIITVSLFVYMTTATSRMAQAQDEKTALEQLVAFNSEYEAYNKRVMYGTDIITVVNKAIVHNEKMLASKKEDPYYINITITVNKKFETTYEKIVNGTQETTPEDPEEIDYNLLPGDVKASFALKT